MSTGESQAPPAPFTQARSTGRPPTRNASLRRPRRLVGASTAVKKAMGPGPLSAFQCLCLRYANPLAAKLRPGREHLAVRARSPHSHRLLLSGPDQAAAQGLPGGHRDGAAGPGRGAAVLQDARERSPGLGRVWLLLRPVAHRLDHCGGRVSVQAVGQDRAV